MRNILAKELKIKFLETLNQVEDFSYEDGNPFLMKIENSRYFVFLKNISSAYFKNSPDVTRVQLPSSNQFSKVVESRILFVIFGYDFDNDAFVCWNPNKIKERLNTKGNVSLYSRESLQTKIKVNELKSGYLSNGEKIVLFKRQTLPLFFEQLPNLFDDSLIDISQVKKATVDKPKKNSAEKLPEITDKKLLARITPILRKNRVLEAVEVCSNFYGDKYKNMSFKDWFKIVNDRYRKLNA